MKANLQYFGVILLFAIIVFVVYHGLKKFVLDKIKVNKWLVLGVGIIFFMVPPLFSYALPRIVSNFVLPGIFVIFFLWFLDLSGFMKKVEKKAETTTYKKISSGSKKKEDITIRPKAKPNRVKNNK